MLFGFPFVIASAIVCATIATMNRSEKIFTKHFWFAVAIFTTIWAVFLIFYK